MDGSYLERQDGVGEGQTEKRRGREEWKSPSVESTELNE